MGYFDEDGGTRNIVKEIERRKSAGRIAARTSEVVQVGLILVAMLCLLFGQLPAIEIGSSPPVVAIAD